MNMQLGQRPGFLKLPKRPSKPRRQGLTHVLDKGCSLRTTREVLSSLADFIDIWKFGWGSSYLDRAAGAKVAQLHAAGIKTCPGGTLLEVSWLQNRTEGFFEFAAEVGFGCIEVSDGATDMPLREKRRLISEARRLGFEVLAEVGSKNPTNRMTPASWLEEIEGDLAAGATWIVAEGRESGTVGLYDEDGQVRRSLLYALERCADRPQIVFEAPQRAQQAFLLRHFGIDVNLGNIDLEDVLSLEALRLGLRADSSGMLAVQEREAHVYL